MNEQALKERIKAIAKGNAINFNECWKQLLLERVLVRIASSPHAEKLIFKGGFMLSYAIDLGRETMDLDFLATKIKAEGAELEKVFRSIAELDLNDGFVFAWDGIEELGQPHMEYPGFRISLSAIYGKMRDKVQVDIGVGDAVEPETRKLAMMHYRDEPIFEGVISLKTYPLESVFAEKLETLMSRGSINSRMKDYHDLYVICLNGLLRKKKLQAAIKATFHARGTRPNFPIQFQQSEIEELDSLWIKHVREHEETARSKWPTTVSVIIESINSKLKEHGVYVSESKK